VPFVERRRLLQHRVQPIAAPARLLELRRDLLVLDRHTEALREPFHCLGEVELLGLANEGDDVAALAAAEAVVELLLRVDGKARRPLFVERTPADVTRARLPQLRARGDDLDHVGCVDDLALRGVLDAGHQIASAYASAKRSVMPAT
jgi:hypothetical protein